MKRRKLVGSNNIRIRENTHEEGTEVELKGYENIYALDTDGVVTTLKERLIEDKLYNSEETTEEPYELSCQFVENGEWEEIK